MKIKKLLECTFLVSVSVLMLKYNNVSAGDTVECITTVSSQVVNNEMVVGREQSPYVSSNVIEVKVLEKKERNFKFTNKEVTFDQEDYLEPVVYNDYHVTCYCNCESCCGEYAWKHTTATGSKTVEGVTIAVDPSVIPYGSIVELDGHLYIAQDCGGAVNGNHIDVYIEDVGGKHERCVKFMSDLGQDYGNTIRVWVAK